MKSCQVCGDPTENPEAVHTPCLYAILRPVTILLEKGFAHV